MCVSKYLDIIYKDGNFFICHRRTKIIVVRCLNLNALNQYISENITIYGSFSDYESGLNYSYNNVYSLLKTYGGLDDYDGFLDYSKNDVRNGLLKCIWFHNTGLLLKIVSIDGLNNNLPL